MKSKVASNDGLTIINPKALAMLLAGKNNCEIAAAFGVRHESVRYWRKKLGINPTRRPGRPRKNVFQEKP